MNLVYLGKQKNQIADAMSRIKKTVARSQSIRKGDLSQISNSEDTNRNLRETPYENPIALNPKSRFYSDSKNLQYPEIYRSQIKNRQNLKLLSQSKKTFLLILCDSDYV